MREHDPQLITDIAMATAQAGLKSVVLKVELLPPGRRSPRTILEAFARLLEKNDAFRGIADEVRSAQS